MTAANVISNSAHTLSSTTNELRDIKPPVEIPSGWAWLSWVAAVLAVFALLYIAWRYWQKRRAETPPVPVMPVHVRARQRLQEALALLGQPREFCILVSDTIRLYLEERFNFHAPERTTEEFLYELPDRGDGEIAIDKTLVTERLKAIVEDEDLRRYIL